MYKQRDFKKAPWIHFVRAIVTITLIGTVAGCGIGKVDTDTVLSKIDVPRGICVVLGDSNCDLALDLARRSELLVYVQLPLN